MIELVPLGKCLFTLPYPIIYLCSNFYLVKHLPFSHQFSFTADLFTRKMMLVFITTDLNLNFLPHVRVASAFVDGRFSHFL